MGRQAGGKAGGQARVVGLVSVRREGIARAVREGREGMENDGEK